MGPQRPRSVRSRQQPWPPSRRARSPAPERALLRAGACIPLDKHLTYPVVVAARRAACWARASCCRTCAVKRPTSAPSTSRRARAPAACNGRSRRRGSTAAPAAPACAGPRTARASATPSSRTSAARWARRPARSCSVRRAGRPPPFVKALRLPRLTRVVSSRLARCCSVRVGPGGPVVGGAAVHVAGLQVAHGRRRVHHGLQRLLADRDGRLRPRHGGLRGARRDLQRQPRGGRAHRVRLRHGLLQLPRAARQGVLHQRRPRSLVPA